MSSAEGPHADGWELLQVIAEHLYQQGNFTVGDTFVVEAGISDSAALKKPYTAMHAVLEQVSGSVSLLIERTNIEEDEQVIGKCSMWVNVRVVTIDRQLMICNEGCSSGIAVQIIARNLQPALKWASEHQAQLVASNGEAAVHAFEFRLHRLQFLHCLQNSGRQQTPLF